MNMQKQKPIWSKILAMLCALALCISMVPAASAAPGQGASTSNVNKVTMGSTGINGFATLTEDITESSSITEDNVTFSLEDSVLVMTPSSGNFLPKTVTVYAQAYYQPTITVTSGNGVTFTVSDYGNNWWKIDLTLGATASGMVSLNAEAVPTYTVTVEQPEGARNYAYSALTSTTVKAGGQFKFFLVPVMGYNAPDVSVTPADAGSLVPDSSGTYTYTVTNITSNITITIGTTTAKTYTVTFPTGDGYTIKSTSDDSFTDNRTTVNHGENVSFKVNLNDDYNKSDVTVYANGSELEVNEASVYTINNITMDQTVSVVGVEKNKYTVTLPENWTGYTISTVDGTSVPAGGTFTFTVTPAAGYTITKVTADDQELTSENNQYSIEVNQDTTIKVTATATQYTVDVSATNATVSLASTVSYGNNTFTVTPVAGYKVDSVTFDGATVAPGANNNYTIYVTRNDHQLVVTTSPVVEITLTTTVTGAGTTVVTVKTSNDWTSGNVDGVKIVGYGTLYSDKTFDPSALKDDIADRSHSSEYYTANGVTVHNYYYDTAGIDLSALTGYTFSYKFNNSSNSVSAGSRFGAGWIELQQGDTTWIITTANAVALS